MESSGQEYFKLCVTDIIPVSCKEKEREGGREGGKEEEREGEGLFNFLATI